MPKLAGFCTFPVRMAYDLGLSPVLNMEICSISPSL